MKKKILFLVIFIYSSCLIFTDTNTDMAQLYIDEAFIYFNQEKYDLSIQNLEISYNFSKNSSASWYLAGLLREKQGNRIGAIESYEKSLQVENYSNKYFHSAYFNLLNLLNITGQHRKAIDIFLSDRIILENYSDIVLKISDSAYKYGKVDLSNELALGVYKKYPDNLKSILYLIRSDRTDSLYDLIGKNLKNIEIDKYDDEIFHSIIQSSENPNKQKLIELYRSLFGNDAYYYFINDIEHELINGSNNLMIRSSGNDILKDGVYFGDYNFDGISDEIISVTGDDLTYFKDKNQDNIPEFSIKIKKNIPTNIFIDKGDITFEYKYSNFPYLEEISYTKGSLKRIYKLLPATSFSPLKKLSDFSWKYNSYRSSNWEIEDLNLVEILQLSSSFSEFFSEMETPFREYKVLDGEINQINEDSLLDGHFDHFMKVSGWLIESGQRDINGDEIIDIYEYYEYGKLSGVAVDWNNNGISEFIEDWSVLEIKIWEFNEDFYIDAEYIISLSDTCYYKNALENVPINKYDVLSWDFSNEKFWFKKY